MNAQCPATAAISCRQHPLFLEVADLARAHGWLDDVDELFVGFSGGADSTALLLIMQQLFPRTVAVHFHHGLRADAADADLAWCQAFCRGLGVPCRWSPLTVPARRRPDESAESAARRLRLQLWHRLCRRRQTVALGHHLDDQIETVFLRLFRGSNVSGLAGLRVDRRLGGTRFLRPLLGLRRCQLTAFLHAVGVREWCHDASNDSDAHQRNRLRARLPQLLAAFPEAESGLVHSLAHLREDAEALESLAASLVGDLADLFPAALLRTQHAALWPRLVRAWARSRFGVDLILDRGAVERLTAAVAGPTTKSVTIMSGPEWSLQWRRPGLRFLARQAPTLSPRRWRWREQPDLALTEIGVRLHAAAISGDLLQRRGADSELWDVGALGDELLVRGRRQGDQMVPFGGDRPVRLKKLVAGVQDSAQLRDRLLLVCHLDGNVLWVPGVRRAEHGRLPAHAQQAVKLSYETL